MTDRLYGTNMSDLRRGYLFGLSAYIIWGFFPLLFKQLKAAGALEILSHRVIWSLASVAIAITVMRRWPSLRRLAAQPAKLGGISLAAILIAINWCTYIYGVNAGHVVETALGYFINPLVIIIIGVVVLHERLRPAQWVAVGIGALAVVVLTIDYGRLPWIALTLAASFGLYGFVKKRLALPAADGLFVESAVLLIPALGYVGLLMSRGESTLGTVSTTHTLLLLISGVATAIPLLLFAGAANRIPLYGIGMLQYVGPLLQFGLGVFIFHEPMPPARWAGFGIVWLALAVFSADGLWSARRSSRMVHATA